LSATGSNGNENTAGPDPEEPQAHRESGTAAGAGRAPAGAGMTGFPDLAAMREAILRAERARLAGAAGAPAGRDAVLEALLRARRGSQAATAAPGVFALDAGPEPESDSETPLRSRSGGVNKPRAVVPTALLAAEAVRLVDAAHTKRARMVTAIGLPAVFLAATGVAVVPTVANAASTSSAPTSSSTACAPGSSAVTNPAAPKSSAPSSAPSTPSSSSSKAGSAPTPGAPQPTSGQTTPQQSAPSGRPSSAPSGTTAPPVKPTPTGAPSGTAAPPSSAATTAPSSAPSSTPSPSSSVTWWNPLTWLGTQVAQVFNPPASSSSTNSTVNKLAAAPAAAPSSNPTSSPAPLLSIGLGDSSSSPSSPSKAPSSKPSSNPTTVPSTPQPTSSGSTKPSTPATPSTPSSSASTPSSSSSASGVPSTITYGGKTYQLPTTACVAAAAPTALREVKWHLDATSLTLTNQHFLGFQDVNTGDGRVVQVMAIHADRVDLTDMVTYNEDGRTRVYSDGGKGKNVSLTNVTLHVLQQKGVMDLPILGIPLGQVTLGPPGEAGTDPTSQLVMGLLELNLPLPPVTFTDVHVDQYTLISDTLDIPHFNISLNGIVPQS
jgi:hypothetical protein